jgi:transcriptional regulator of acetoin/glycerol metabolism
MQPHSVASLSPPDTLCESEADPVIVPFVRRASVKKRVRRAHAQHGRATLSRHEIRIALERYDGSISGSARALGIHVQSFYGIVIRNGLRSHAAQLRARRRERVHDETLQALRKHAGHLTASARELGMPVSNLVSRLHRLGLFETARALRPSERFPTPGEIRAALRRQGGRVADTARELGRNQLHYFIRKYGLTSEVENERRAYRRQLRARLLRALIKHRGVLAAAARELSTSPTGLRAWVSKLELASTVEKLRPARPEGPPIGQLRTAIRSYSGNLSAAARSLGISYGVIHAEVERRGLQDAVEDARRLHEKRVRRETRRALTKHQGHLSASARALGITPTSLAARIKALNLTSEAKQLLPRKPTPAEESALLLGLLHRHNGQLSNVQAELRVAKGTLRAWMMKHDLVAEADALRADANLIGPRTRLPFGRVKERRAKLLGLIESCGWNLSRATAQAGVSPATFYKNMRDLGIKRPARLDPWQRFHRLVDALRRFRGHMHKVALSMGVPVAAVLRWCDEYDVDPYEYRK